MNKNNKRFNKTYFKIFVVIWWVTHIFNIVYTGLLGWNAHPGSELEQWLDNISVSSFISDLIILFRAMHEPVKQEKKVGNRK
jgi:hypothetical protein